MNTDQILGATCYECDRPFMPDEWEQRHSQHAEWCLSSGDGEDACCCDERHDVHEGCCVNCNGRLFAELRAKQRGHHFYPRQADLAAIPALYSTEDLPLGDRIVWLHYFTGSADWWVVEFNPSTGQAFGYACLGDPDMAEWGTFHLPELEELYLAVVNTPEPQRLWPPVIVERDLWWDPKPVSQCNLPGRGAGL